MALVTFATMAVAAPLAAAAPPGLGNQDSWVDANGDEMFGNLDMGEFNVLFSNGELSGSSSGAGLPGDVST
jgi:hypothetical protein